MSMNKLGAAVALALLAAPAFAAPTENNTLYIGGATAVDRTLFESMVDQTNGICDGAQAINVYTKAANMSGFANWTVHCTVRAGLGALSGTEIGVAKVSLGSEYGIDPVADGLTAFANQNITFANPAACGTPSAVPADANNSRLAYTLNPSCGNTAPTAPQAGVSDVEPALFGASASVKSRLINNGAAVTPFTMPVSTNLYRALQVAQGLTGACASDTAATQSEACTPNVTIAQVRALMSQTVYATSQLFGSGTDFGTTYAAVDPTILICRRGDTSGSQKSFERLYFGQNCGGRTPTLTIAADPSVTFNGVNCKTTGCAFSATNFISTQAPNYIYQGSGSGQVESCLDWAAGNNTFAVGVLSADRVPNDSTKRFRYVKIDGVLPTVENVLSQKWVHSTENVVTQPTGTSPNLAAFNTGNRSAILSLVLSGLRNPVNVAKTHSLPATVGVGRLGLSIRPNPNFAPLASDTASTRPVAPTIRAASNTAPVNNCTEMSVAGEDVIKF